MRLARSAHGVASSVSERADSAANQGIAQPTHTKKPHGTSASADRLRRVYGRGERALTIKDTTSGIEPHISLAEAGHQWGVSVKTLRRRISTGELPATYLSARCIRVKASDVASLFRPIPATTSLRVVAA